MSKGGTLSCNMDGEKKLGIANFAATVAVEAYFFKRKKKKSRRMASLDISLILSRSQVAFRII